MSNTKSNPSSVVKGYKVFTSDWTCRGKQYTCPGKFEEDVTPQVCHQGMHFSEKLTDCFSYYTFNPANHVAEVIAYGVISREGTICATDKLEVVREIPWTEVLEIVNSGNWNSGYDNSGKCNSGNWNSGDWNSGKCNSGCFNTVTPTITLFNRPSDWTIEDWHDSEARALMEQFAAEMEQAEDEDKAQWWQSLEPSEKEAILSIPNFDADIFKGITGIDVRK